MTDAWDTSCRSLLAALACRKPGLNSALISPISRQSPGTDAELTGLSPIMLASLFALLLVGDRSPRLERSR
jgi:hypothetical protein